MPDAVVNEAPVLISRSTIDSALPRRTLGTWLSATAVVGVTLGDEPGWLLAAATTATPAIRTTAAATDKKTEDLTRRPRRGAAPMPPSSDG